MKTVVILGVDKLGRKVTEKVSAPANTSFSALAKDKLGLVKVSAIMTENMFNQSKEV